MSDYLKDLVDYNMQSIIITFYPIMTCVFYLFCKKYYKYLLNYNLLMVDMYDNTYEYYNKETQTEQILFAFNEIPT